MCEGNVREITEQNLAELKTIPDIKLWLEPHNENTGENMVEWVEPLHCTAYYDASGEDVNYANQVQNALSMEFNIETADLWIGKEGGNWIGSENFTTTTRLDVPTQKYNATNYINCCKRTQS